MNLSRRSLLLAAAATAGAATTRSLAQPASPPREFRIGFQKSGAIVVAKQRGDIERRLRPLGIEAVKWLEFQSGPPLLEALSVGSIDFGTTGDTPPIFAQAAGADLVYAATIPQASSAVLVPEGSPIATVAALRGKRIAFTKGSSSHNFTVQVLKKAGIAFADVTPVHLSPADATAAFARGSVDAWTIWDPFFALAERNQKAKPIARIEGVVDSHSFYLANGAFAKSHPRILKAAIDELAATGRWAEENRGELAHILAEATGVDIEAQRVAAARAKYAVGPLTTEAIADQQLIADEFHRLGLIPKSISVRDVAWTAPAAS
jgi:sulfonate transport system substrate-binding protein